jgi:hypothetical protein
MERIVSGGQTGVDRAALDVAIALGMHHGGWCPAGRRAEDGPIPHRYRLRETPGGDYAQRTLWNVRDSDATLVLVHGHYGGGTGLTVRAARLAGKGCLVVDLQQVPLPGAVADWLREQGARTLNVAGPRESQRPGIGELAAEFLLRELPLARGDGGDGVEATDTPAP